MIYCYSRISSVDQNEARQINALSEYEGELVLDKCSGAIPFAERESGRKLIELVNSGNVKKIVVLDIDRLGRDNINILQTLKYFKDKKVVVRVHRYGIESLIDGKPNPTFDLITSIMATLSSQELERIRERQLEGIENAKKLGVYQGRKKGTKNKDTLSLIIKYPNVIACLKSNMSLNKIELATGVSKSTVIRIKKEFLRNG
jgi:DNA invertase Pin-like site-specific DNA recombinase